MTGAQKPTVTCSPTPGTRMVCCSGLPTVVGLRTQVLVLTRKKNQRIKIGDVLLTVVRIKDHSQHAQPGFHDRATSVRLGIEAPDDVEIVRTEVLDRSWSPLRSRPTPIRRPVAPRITTYTRSKTLRAFIRGGFGEMRPDIARGFGLEGDRDSDRKIWCAYGAHCCESVIFSAFLMSVNVF